MNNLAWLLPALPLFGFALLGIAGRQLSTKVTAWMGVVWVGTAAVLALVLAIAFTSGGGQPFTTTAWAWVSVRGLQVALTLRYDALTLVMTLVVTGVAFFILLYSAQFMEGERGYSRFFAYMNLFVAAMLVLVLAANLLLLLLGWEGVGLCSYLLIGFWYRDEANGRAAQKAFIVTRIGDAALAIGLFLLVAKLGTLDIATILQRAPQLPVSLTTTVALLLFAGAVGKSAQLPLQTWLPDAMAGPTPVSALIHAATMVTAGVYLVARHDALFAQAPAVRELIAVVGTVTMLLAGFSALTQNDIKRVLAYSTMSQLGLMFVALGVGAAAAAIFHLMTHAFFKALLFLAAGAVIHCVHHEHDITKMGGLSRELPLTFATFVIGGAALAGFPLVTAGFYSKELIFGEAWTMPVSGHVLWALGVAGVLLTSLYISRLLILVFLGPRKLAPSRRPGRLMQGALVVLAALSIVGGFVETPATLGNVHIFSDLLAPVLPLPTREQPSLGTEAVLQLTASLLVIIGAVVAYGWLARTRAAVEAPGPLWRLWRAGWGFDALYDVAFVRPYRRLAQLSRSDLVDAIYRGLAWLLQGANRLLSPTQSGRLRWYAAAMMAGVALILVAAVLT